MREAPHLHETCAGDAVQSEVAGGAPVRRGRCREPQQVYPPPLRVRENA